MDSSVGGKTGINHRLGKNLIGAFYQPQCVVVDTDTLNTLPERELASGFAEVIKYGLIRDAEFFEWQEKNMPSLMARCVFKMLLIYVQYASILLKHLNEVKLTVIYEIALLEPKVRVVSRRLRYYFHS